MFRPEVPFVAPKVLSQRWEHRSSDQAVGGTVRNNRTFEWTGEICLALLETACGG